MKIYKTNNGGFVALDETEKAEYMLTLREGFWRLEIIDVKGEVSYLDEDGRAEAVVRSDIVRELYDASRGVGDWAWLEHSDYYDRALEVYRL